MARVRARAGALGVPPSPARSLLPRYALASARNAQLGQTCLMKLPRGSCCGALFRAVLARHKLRHRLSAGTHDVLRIQLRPEAGGDGGGKKRFVLLPFAKALVPMVDLAAGRMEVTPPEGLLELASSAGDKQAQQERRGQRERRGGRRGTGGGKEQEEGQAAASGRDGSTGAGDRAEG